MRKSSKLKVLVVILIILLILSLGYAGYLSYDKFIKKNGCTVEDCVCDCETLPYIKGSTITESTVQNIIAATYFNNDNLKLSDYTIEELSFEDNTEEIKTQYGYSDTDILFTMKFNVKPLSDETYKIWLSGNGEEGSDGWIINKKVVGTISKDNAGNYYLKEVGTGR